jgi:hypothetical protein
MESESLALQPRGYPIDREKTPERAKGGRKWDNPTILANIIRHALAGCSRSDCFRLAGLHVDTGFDWLRQARQQPEKYPILVRWAALLDRAEAHFNKRMVSRVVEAADSGDPRNWPAAMTMLERRDPENWGKRDKTTVETKGQPLVQLNQVVLSDPGARDASRELLRRLSAVSPHESIGIGMGDEPDSGVVTTEE